MVHLKLLVTILATLALIQGGAFAQNSSNVQECSNDQCTSCEKNQQCQCPGTSFNRTLYCDHSYLNFYSGYFGVPHCDLANNYTCLEVKDWSKLKKKKNLADCSEIMNHTCVYAKSAKRENFCWCDSLNTKVPIFYSARSTLFSIYNRHTGERLCPLEAPSNDTGLSNCTTANWINWVYNAKPGQGYNPWPMMLAIVALSVAIYVGTASITCAVICK